MMPHTRYDDVEYLKAELEQERRYKETIDWSNTELERSISELSSYLDQLDANSRAADDNEWKVRFDSQTALNKQLKDQKDFLETELTDARRRLTTGTYPEAMNFNLEALNEPELLRLVKHLERMRNDTFNNLRDTEWKLDKESKEFHHFDEMRRAYKGDLKHANATIERLRLGHVIDPSGAVSPTYPQGYFSYMDSHGGRARSDFPLGSPDSSNDMGIGGMGMGMSSRMGRGMDGGMGRGMDGGMGGGMGDGMGSMGRKSQKKGGGSRSPQRPMEHESPSRSKSRGDKKSKKKEAPPAEESPTRGGRMSTMAFLGSGSDNETTGTEVDTVIERQSNAPSTGDTFTISVSKEDDPITKRRESLRHYDS